MIQKMTGHSSEELERYKHFSPEFSKQTTELIAGKPVEELKNNDPGTFWPQSPENEKVACVGDPKTTDNKDDNGEVDGARTRDLQCNRLKFRVADLA